MNDEDVFVGLEVLPQWGHWIWDEENKENKSESTKKIMVSEITPNSESKQPQAANSPTEAGTVIAEVQSTAAENKMELFPAEEIQDLKHVIYNLLVQHFNREDDLVLPVKMVFNGQQCTGFQFNSRRNLKRDLPEMYANYIRGGSLNKNNLHQVLVEDLQRFYLRSLIDLLAKYFHRVDRWTFLDRCDQMPLFIPGGTLEAAHHRLRNIRSKPIAGKEKNGKTGKLRTKRSNRFK